ncbi:MAG: DUF4271 domain-containing protein [Flavobacteriaceae bacterium]|nr:DUF4271 domain-containing protein [Flavobacteriaceae bacterium]
MEALDRVVISHNWITIIFVFSMLLLFILKVIDHKRLAGYTKAFFVKGFIKRKAEEKMAFFSLFSLVIFLFSIVVSSLTLILVLGEFSSKYTIDFLFFIKVLVLVSLYFLFFLGVDVILSSVFQIKNELRYFIAAKIAYLYNIALWLFPLLILTVYGLENVIVLAGIVGLLFILSTLLVFMNNKNLIVNKLFYKIDSKRTK